MSLQFRQRKTGTRPIHWVLSIGALLLTLALLAVWLLIGYHQSKPEPDDGEEPIPPTYEEPLPTTENCMLILNVENNQQFILIQTAPKEHRITVVPIPSSLADEKGNSLPKLLAQSGSIRVMQTVASALELPIEHYITLDRAGVNKLLTELEEGVSLKLPETVNYTDENGLSSTIRSGKRELSASQATAVLQYTGWKKAKSARTVAADMVASVLNRYLVSGRSLRGYFGVLANSAQTDLRIDHYTAYANALAQLAEHNTGNICTVITLKGSTKNGHFVPDLDAIRRDSGLYP